jgi:hypothetical protein
MAPYCRGTSRASGGGVMTYVGFSKMMENAFHTNAKVHYTTDKTPPHKNDTKVSPSSGSSQGFIKLCRTGEARCCPNHWKDELVDDPERFRMPIHRVCVATSAELVGASHMSPRMIAAMNGKVFMTSSYSACAGNRLQRHPHHAASADRDLRQLQQPAYQCLR